MALVESQLWLRVDESKSSSVVGRGEEGVGSCGYYTGLWWISIGIR